MTPLLQFSLTFVTLIVLAIILYTRLGRYERYLKDLEGISELNERLRELCNGLQSLGTKRIETQVADLQVVLMEIRDLLARPQEAPLEVPVMGASTALETSLPQLVLGRLTQLGYERISIVSDLEGVDPHSAVRVVVEASRGGMPVKGSLVVRGGEILEMDLKSSYTTFP
ncbi:MAG TPA: hypothetical protein ENK02_07860 [Planctomycetes bacterium]|nr:hypothetical protein [Planctomycetota bacterium]